MLQKEKNDIMARIHSSHSWRECRQLDVTLKAVSVQLNKITHEVYSREDKIEG